MVGLTFLYDGYFAAMRDLQLQHGLTIPACDLQWSASRAGGPGGQHVNKTSTKVDLRFDLRSNTTLPPDVKQRLRQLAKGRFDQDGRLVIASRASRSQAANLDDARARLIALIEQARVKPRRRRATKPSKSAKRRRLQAKRHQAQKKASRGRVDYE